MTMGFDQTERLGAHEVAAWLRRHPAFLARQRLAAGSEHTLAVVHNIGDHRASRPANSATATGESVKGRVLPLAEGNRAGECARTPLAGAVPIPFLRPLVEFCYPIAVGCIEYLPRLMPHHRTTDGR